jgi:hypothetical protein
MQFNISHLDKRDVSLPTNPPGVPGIVSIGVEYFCMSFTDHFDYRALPLTLSNIMSSSATAMEKSSYIQSLDRALAEVTPRSIKGCLVTGAIFATLAIFFSICSLLAHPVGLVSVNWILGSSTHLRSICSIICCIPLLFLTVILYGSRLKAKLPIEITLETSEASRQVLAALIFAVLMGSSIIFGYMQVAQGKYGDVEKLSWRALEGSEKELGAQFPSTLTSVSNLALVLRYQGKYDEAEKLNRRALEGREMELGA